MRKIRRGVAERHCVDDNPLVVSYRRVCRNNDDNNNNNARLELMKCKDRWKKRADVTAAFAELPLASKSRSGKPRHVIESSVRNEGSAHGAVFDGSLKRLVEDTRWMFSDVARQIYSFLFAETENGSKLKRRDKYCVSSNFIQLPTHWNLFTGTAAGL